MSEAVATKPNWIKRIFLTILAVPMGGFLILLFLATFFPFKKTEGVASVGYEELRILTENSIRSSMNDPASTQFRNVHQGATADVVCGEVNARNGFGGYGEFRFFYARSTPSPITPQLEIQPQMPKSRAELDSFIANYKSNCGSL